MGNALRDQLLKAGLVNEKQLKQAAKEKRKETNQRQGQNEPDTDAARLRAQKAQAEKAERDRQLNQQRREEAEKKALASQIRQLIETHRQPRGDGEIPFNFPDGGKVKRLYLSASVREQIVRGNLVIVRLDKQYELVTPDIAEKIRARSAGSVVLWNEPKATPTETPADDPYAKFQVPDDLMW